MGARRIQPKALKITAVVAVVGVAFAVGFVSRGSIGDLLPDEGLAQLLPSDSTEEVIEAHPQSFAGARVIDADGALIVKGGPRSGVTFSFSLRAAETYRLVFASERVQGDVWFRLRRGTRPPVLGTLGGAGKEYILSGVRGATVAVYGTSSFAFRVTDLRVTRCEDCRTRSEIRTLLLGQITALGQALRIDRLAAARMLLGWAVENSDFALDDSSLIDARGRDLPDLYNVFRRDVGGVYCGGVASFYDKILKLFGYPSFTFDFGNTTASLTHSTVIVPIRDGGHWRFYMFDPTFNLVLLDTNTGRPVSVPDAVRAALRGRYGSLEFADVPVAKSFVAKPETVAGRDDVSCRPVRPVGDGRVQCFVPDYSLALYARSNAARLRAAGYRAGELALVDLMAAGVWRLGPSTRPPAVSTFKTALRGLGIPFSDRLGAADVRTEAARNWTPG